MAGILYSPQGKVVEDIQAVTSIGLIASPSSVFDIANSPVTGADDIDLSLDQQSGNKVLASPANGSLGDPEFRVLTPSDVPVISDLGGTLSHGDLGDLTTADDHTQYIAKAPQTDARNEIESQSATVVPLSVKGAAAQSDPLQEYKNSGGTVIAKVTASGGANFDGSVGVGVASNDASAKHQVDSTTQGSLTPRMTTSQRNSIASPAAGLEVFDTDVGKKFVYYGGVWYEMSAPSINNLPNSSLEAWENGISSAPDGWSVTGSGATIAQESSIVKHGTYSAKLTRVGNDCYFRQQNAYSILGNTYCRDRVYTFAAYVYATVASRVRLSVEDDSGIYNSAYHTGSSTWERLQVTFRVNSSATFLRVGFEVVTGNTSGYIDGCILSEGYGTDYLQPSVRSFNRFPTRATMWHDEATVIAGSAIDDLLSTSQIYNVFPRQSPAAINDAFTQSFWVEAGTYTLYVLGCTSNDRGIVTWYVDEVAIGSPQDWYSASATFNIIKTIGSISITNSGYHVLKGIVASKNASSSAYVMSLTKYWLAQAND